MGVSFEEILQNSIPIDDGLACGIYFLISGEEVVYVGQSKYSIQSRIKSHIKDKTFDRYYIIPCAIDELDYLETKFIAEYTPIYNRAIKASDGIIFIKVLEKSIANQAVTLDGVVIGGRLYANLDSLTIS